MASIYKKPIFLRDPRTGRRVKTKSKKWWGRFRDVNDREKRVPLAIDRTAAQAMLSEHVRRVEREKVGLIEPTDEHRKRPIAHHVADYEKYLKSKANAPRYIALAVGRIKTLLAACRFKTIGQITPSAVANWLRHQREKDAFGIATSNDYLVAAKAFCNWLVRDRRLVNNPLAHLQRLNAETDVRRKRRVLTPDELERLIAAAAKSQGRLGRMRGEDRAIVYRLAAFTGLRAQEIASLTSQSFALDADPPTVTVEACYSKHRRRDILPLAEDLCARLRAYLAQRRRERRHADDDRLWPGKWYRKAGRILQRDLAEARKAWIKEAKGRKAREERKKSHYLCNADSAGRVADFHALRHGFITYLVTANVAPKVAQTLARHSTITLTMDRYTHLGVIDLVSALRRLPALTNGMDRRASESDSAAACR
jgi:site-specific recombinase XerD